MELNQHERMTRIEEAQAFMERTVEHLHEELLTLSRKVDALTSRLAKAEASLADRGVGGETSRPADEGGARNDEFELPPHSHMPLDRQAGRTTDPFAPPSGAEPPARDGSR